MKDRVASLFFALPSLPFPSSYSSPCSPHTPPATPTPLYSDVCIVASPGGLIVVFFCFICPLCAFRIASGVLLRRLCKCRFPGLLVQEVDCYVICDVTGAVGLQGRFLVVVVLVKTSAVGDGYRPILATGTIAVGVRHLRRRR